MSYGILLNDKTQNKQIFQDYLDFNPASRGGFSTTNTLYFNTFGFNASEIQIGADQYVNLVPNGNIDLSSLPITTNIDLDGNGGYYCGQNLSRPVVINLCNIVGYEYGVGNTYFNSSISTNSKVILNYSNPGAIYSIGSNLSTTSLTLSNFSNVLSQNYIKNENFVYVKDDGVVFLATYVNNTFNWINLPGEKFYYTVDYYLTCTDASFTGSYLSYMQFKKIVPSVGQLVLVNCASFNDLLSGVYSIVGLNNNIVLQRYNLYTNYPGQIFTASTNIDTYTGITKSSVCYYVPFEYGNTAPIFSKPLQLKQYLGLNTSINNFPLLFQDSVDTSILRLPLNQQSSSLNKISDSFGIGIFVSNWVPDNTLIFGGIDYQIIEGNS